MPWVAGVGAAVGGLLSSSATRSAAGDASDATNAATAENRRQFDIGIERQQPFYDVGVPAARELAGMRFQAPTAESVQSDPGYKFGLEQGRNALEGGAAARGGLYSGNAGRSLLKFGTDYGTTKFNDAFERARSAFGTNQNALTALTNIGQGAANQQTNAGANFSNANAGLLTGNANAQGAAAIAQGNIWGNAINQGISQGNRYNWWQRPQAGGGSGTVDPNAYGNSAGSGPEGWWADGGPVRGPGGPRDDMVTAHLSDGEHVFESKAVTAMGGGSNAKGQRRLNALRSVLRKGN